MHIKKEFVLDTITKTCYYPTYNATYNNMSGIYTIYSCYNLEKSYNALKQYAVNNTYTCYYQSDRFVFDKKY